jgi:hypothetical protein
MDFAMAVHYKRISVLFHKHVKGAVSSRAVGRMSSSVSIFLLTEYNETRQRLSKRAYEHLNWKGGCWYGRCDGGTAA